MYCVKKIRGFLSICVLVFFVCSPLCYGKKPKQDEQPVPLIAGLPLVNNVPLPDTVVLCGENVPIDRQDVRERLDREFTIIVWDRPQVFLWLKRANRYFPYIEKQLQAAGLPGDLKYLAVAESSLLTHAQSPAGATGYWQFMPKTADEKGLRRDALSDERYSLEHSTAAALTYLKKCHEIFGSWSLAMAAYNCGERRVQEAISEQKVSDYYRLKLPTETERYVFRIAAIKIVLENYKNYGYTIPPGELYPPFECDLAEVTLRYKMYIPDCAIAAGTDYKTIRDLNPQFKSYYFPIGTYSVKVPAGSKKKFLKQVSRFSKEAEKRAREQKYYAVKSGDTLSHIAERTGVPVKKLREFNNLRGDTIRPGQKLLLSP
jgi:hypothetical protein